MAFKDSKDNTFRFLWFELAYLLGLIPLFLIQVFGQFILVFVDTKKFDFRLLFEPNQAQIPSSSLATKFTFMPLMLTSVYCSLGLIYSWVLLHRVSDLPGPKSKRS
jgi:hypothetical protein